MDLIDFSSIVEIWYGGDSNWARRFFGLVPMFLVIDLPLTVLTVLGVLRWYIRELTLDPKESLYIPRVSCIISCYSEGDSVLRSIQTLCEQIYQGEIEIIPVIDGADKNPQTLDAVRSYRVPSSLKTTRFVRPIVKWQRGGRVSSLNAGLSMCTGEIVLAVDGDTSFDNTMMKFIVRHFSDPNVPAVAGTLRVRNVWASTVTKIQGIEYLLNIQMGRIGLSEWNIINNISGAFGAFRRDFIKQIGGWDTHTAEDLDLTLRLKSYIGRRRNLRIPFEPKAIGHTDVPTTIVEFMKQRLRWDGDLFFLYVRKHSNSFKPGLTGWSNLIALIFIGLFIQVVVPFIIIAYTIGMLLMIPLEINIALAILLQIIYTVLLLVQFIVAICCVSERPSLDIKLIYLIPLMPLAFLMLRIWSAVALVNEIVWRSHEESSMAPWWVLRKATRF